MEPFEILRDMIRDDKYSSIGGPPQVMKVYCHMNSMPFCVYWPDRQSGKLSFLGRPLLGYESTEYLAIDPDTLETFRPIFTEGRNKKALSAYN